MAKDRKALIEEYRRGNCIGYQGSIYRVVNVMDDKVQIRNKDGNEITVPFSDTLAVPFTEEILKQLKFVKKNNEHIRRVRIPFKADFYFQVGFIMDKYYFTYHVNNQVSSDTFHYLHEMQNLNRFLTGLELF